VNGVPVPALTLISPALVIRSPSQDNACPDGAGCLSVEIYEALWRANPKHVGIGDGLARALNNLGVLLKNAGQAAEAERAYRRSVEIYEALWRANPEHVDITAGYAGSLCSLQRFEEAEPLIDRVLRKVPKHPYALQLKDYIASVRGGDTAGATRGRGLAARALGWLWTFLHR
jgi:tetratricopeptide (TPR) repeat protein